MKSILTIVVVVLALMSPTVYAGAVAGQSVDIYFEDDWGVASGTMSVVRASKNDVERIGCSYKGVVDAEHQDYFPWDHAVNQWAWCWAKDANGVEAFCFTENPNLLDAFQAISPFSFIRFVFTDIVVDSEGVSRGLCTRFDFSTQSNHLPKFTTKNK